MQKELTASHRLRSNRKKDCHDFKYMNTARQLPIPECRACHTEMETDLLHVLVQNIKTGRSVLKSVRAYGCAQ